MFSSLYFRLRRGIGIRRLMTNMKRTFMMKDYFVTHGDEEDEDEESDDLKCFLYC